MNIPKISQQNFKGVYLSNSLDPGKQHDLGKEVQKALNNKKYTSVEKNTFGSVNLPNIIREAAGDEEFDIELIGLCTDICVVSNALLLKANFPEVPMSVDSRCCAGVTPDKHEAALETMRSCQIDIIG